MALADCQVQVRDLVLGPGTSYQVLSGFNPFNRQVRATQTAPRAWNHGGWSGAEWQAEAVIPIPLVVRNPPTLTRAAWLAAHQQLAAAFAPVADTAVDVELRFAVGAVEYVLFGRPRMVEPQTYSTKLGHAFTQCAFVALDPLIYSGELHCTEAILLPIAVGGLAAPFHAPFHVPGSLLGGGAELVNAGTAQVGLSIRIDGPVSQPRVTLERADGIIQTLTIDIELDAGQFLEIVTGARTVFLNGLPQASRRGQASGTFPLLPPGTSQISFRAGDFNDQASATVCWRDGWF